MALHRTKGQAAPSANTLALSSGGGILRSGMALDAQGICGSPTPATIASCVSRPACWEQASNAPAGGPGSRASRISYPIRSPANASQSLCGASTAASERCGTNFLVQPAGLGFDAVGRLFVADNANRVVVYAPPFAIGQLASRIMGVVLPTTAQPVPPVVSESTLGRQRRHVFHRRAFSSSVTILM